VIYDKGKIKFEPNANIANLNDVGASIHQQLVLTVEWAKSLNEFRALSLDDQASLLRLNATSLIVFAVALRSLHTENGICLANDKLLPTDHAALVGDINAVVGRIVSELVRPMRDLNLDTQEYVALKGRFPEKNKEKYFCEYQIGKRFCI
jgi:ABC-type transport system involved in Fe-S cluster assembly fused permease/ATPase subunit